MRLYRYRKANLEYLKTEILKDEFFLWNLNDQNDPFEGRLLYKNNICLDTLLESLINTRKELQSNHFKWKDWLMSAENKAYYERLKKASDFELKLIVKNSISRGDYNQNGIKLIKEGYQKMTDHLVMSCFSGKKNNPVMFAHYGDNHKGVCLEYKVDSRDFFKVEYVENFPTLNLLNAKEELIMKYRTYTKQKDWEYEDEYRLILYNRNPGVYSNERIKLQSIYLGANSSESTKKGLQDILDIKKERISLFSLSLNDENYELKCNQID